ncbi:hypothetical protein EDC56_0530 [Sinobacterium caligoides]|uniref:Lipoprotein n=1 Tax=Sinobacterium caligoides TaxID=933926 RepID=A0A3N2DYS8_9GAMM|nr:hypothetical protein [Sinobacterium caligoides]ROS05011.1 hypothetical protein EDC56_0530 [Sinobacterium caligoides]
MRIQTLLPLCLAAIVATGCGGGGGGGGGGDPTDAPTPTPTPTPTPEQPSIPAPSDEVLTLDLDNTPYPPVQETAENDISGQWLFLEKSSGGDTSKIVRQIVTITSAATPGEFNVRYCKPEVEPTEQQIAALADPTDPDQIAALKDSLNVDIEKVTLTNDTLTGINVGPLSFNGYGTAIHGELSLAASDSNPEVHNTFDAVKLKNDSSMLNIQGLTLSSMSGVDSSIQLNSACYQYLWLTQPANDDGSEVFRADELYTNLGNGELSYNREITTRKSDNKVLHNEEDLSIQIEDITINLVENDSDESDTIENDGSFVGQKYQGTITGHKYDNGQSVTLEIDLAL